MEIKLSYARFSQSAHFTRCRSLAVNAGSDPKKVFAMAVEALNQAFGGMEHGIRYKTEHLFEADVWEGIHDGVRRSVGICLSYFTDADLVPLSYANKPNANNKLYQLKVAIDPSLYSFRAC